MDWTGMEVACHGNEAVMHGTWMEVARHDDRASLFADGLKMGQSMMKVA